MSDRDIFYIVSPKNVGKQLAHSGDEQQAELLNAFAEELRVSCRHARNLETQLCWISDKLDAEGRKLIEELAAFVALRKEKP